MEETLTIKKAKSLLPRRKRLHTFSQLGPILMGADVDRSEIIERIESNEISLSGPKMTSMDHGLAIFMDGSWLFVETKRRNV